MIDLASGLPAAQAPRVVPEANAQVLAAVTAPYLLTSPSAPGVALATVLAVLPESISIRRVTVTACLAVSSRGREGISELARQRRNCSTGVHLSLGCLTGKWLSMCWPRLSRATVKGTPRWSGRLPLSSKSCWLYRRCQWR